ncbi:MAG: thioredoxin domain-containing protein [Armatimonadetes bacterium]|nr:thioredoxin domain-containing protein [Armatimonadota bacterium]
MARDRSSEIRWEEWSSEAFDRARREGKPVLLTIGAPWCHWCHVLDRTSYSDPDVIALINDRFVPVRVHADRRPDLQDRYLMGGWPTTAVLTPDARILTGSTYMPPEQMLRVLRQADQVYREDRETVTMRVARMTEEAEVERRRLEHPGETLDARALDALDAVLRREFDWANGGFGTEPKFPFPDAVRLAFLLYRRSGDEHMLEIARTTLDGMAGLMDPVWGGMYRYSVDPHWRHPHYEKMLYTQAGALENYVEAYQVTGEEKYLEIALGIRRYVERFLSDRERGGFYGSQDADAGSHEPEADLVTGEEYFAKGEDERLAIGVPYVDRAVYAGWNSMMCSAYFRLCGAADDADAGGFAAETVERLLRENLRDGLVYHYNDGEPRLPGLLANQAHFARALIDGFQTTGRREYLEHAVRIARVMLEEMQDRERGGFYYQHPGSAETLGGYRPHKPFEENACSARMLIELSYLAGDASYREAAGRALEAVSYPRMVESIIGAGYGLALDLYLAAPMQIVVVGRRGDTETGRMLRAGLRAYEPKKIIRILDPDEDPLRIGEAEYPSRAEPVAYVSQPGAPTRPVAGSEELAAALKDLPPV